MKDEFPSYPFSIGLDDELLLKLDDPFTDEPVIFINDDRSTDSNYYWKGISQSEKNKHNRNIKIEQVDGQKITLRQILLKMSKTQEYLKIEESGYPHHFLEQLQSITKPGLVVILGFKNKKTRILLLSMLKMYKNSSHYNF